MIEKRFAQNLGIKNADDILSVALDKDVHKKITKAFRDEIGYNNQKKQKSLQKLQIHKTYGKPCARSIGIMASRICYQH